MISIQCDFCHDELWEPGAILISPPDFHFVVRQSHICVGCYEAMWMAVVTAEEESSQ